MHCTSRSIARALVGRTRSYATTATVHPPLVALSPTARNQAEKISAEFKGTSATGENTKNFIGGEFVESKAEKWIDVLDPVRVPMQACRVERGNSQACALAYRPPKHS